MLLVAKVVQLSRCAIYDRGSTFWAQCLWRGSSAIVSEELLNHDVVGTPFVFYYSAVVVFIPIYLENNMYRVAFLLFLNVNSVSEVYGRAL